MAEATLNRREAVARLLADRRDLLIVTGLGSATYDCAAAGDDSRNFYLWGAMGGTVATALGIALARPDRPVMALTGDGDMLMGIGSLSTVGAQKPANLSVVVLDNGLYGETGAQTTATRLGTSLSGVAKACGLTALDDIRTLDGVDALAERVQAKAGPLFATVMIGPEEHPKVLPPRDGAYLRSRFREAVVGTGP